MNFDGALFYFSKIKCVSAVYIGGFNGFKVLFDSLTLIVVVIIILRNIVMFSLCYCVGFK